MEPSVIKGCAGQLFKAMISQNPIMPLTVQNKELTVDDAYAIQRENMHRAQDLGEVVTGKKIGLTSKSVRKRMGVNEPDYGYLLASMERPDGRMDTAHMIQPRVEGGLAFVLKEDLAGGKITAADVCEATEYVVAALEVIDSRIVNWNVRLEDTVADNASSGRYVLGKNRKSAIDVRSSAIRMKMYKDGIMIYDGIEATAEKEPCESIAWLANQLWHSGDMLKKGEVVLSGAVSPAFKVKRGDLFTASFTLFGLLEAEFE